jgi:hypothetical protein
VENLYPATAARKAPCDQSSGWAEVPQRSSHSSTRWGARSGEDRPLAAAVERVRHVPVHPALHEDRLDRGHRGGDQGVIDQQYVVQRSHSQQRRVDVGRPAT